MTTTRTIRTTLFSLVTALVLACGGSQTPNDPITNPPPAKDAVEVTIASVTLADDCGTGPTGAPVVVEEAPAPAPELADRSMQQERSSKMAAGARACEQSALQLRVRNGTAAASTVAVKKIEIVDETGAVVGELTPRAPSRWNADAYEAWDEQVAPDQVLQVSYALSQPLVQRGGTYTVRVTVAYGDTEQTLEHAATLQAEASLPPDAVT